MHKKLIKPAAIGIIAVVLTAAGIKASDSILSRESGNGQCPDDMVLVLSPEGSFCIDKYEASANDDCVYQDPGNINESAENLRLRSCFAVSKADRLPWRYITRDQAALACAKAGKRLAASREWSQAALGTPDKEKDWTAKDCHVSKNWDAQPGLTGSSEECVSTAGAFDMIGNVWEWVEGTVRDGALNGSFLPDSGYVEVMGDNGLAASTAGKPSDLSHYSDYHFIKDTSIRGIAHGGFWDNKELAGQYASYIVANPSSAEAGIGFRCVK